MKLTNAEVNQFRKIGYINKLIFKDSECEFYKNNFEKVTKKCSKIPFQIGIILVIILFCHKVTCSQILFVLKNV